MDNKNNFTDNVQKKKEDKKGKAKFSVQGSDFLLDSHKIKEKMWLDLPLSYIICSFYR